MQIPWELVICILIFFVVLFYLIFFQPYLSALISRFILYLIVPDKVKVKYKRFACSFLTGRAMYYDLVITTNFCQLKIYCLSFNLYYWRCLPKYRPNENRNKSMTAIKAKGCLLLIFNPQESVIDDLDKTINLYQNGSTVEEITEYLKSTRPIPHFYHIPFFIRVILPMQFVLKHLLIVVGNPKLPSIFEFTTKKIKGEIFLKARPDNHSNYKIRSEFDISELNCRTVKNSSDSAFNNFISSQLPITFNDDLTFEDSLISLSDNDMYKSQTNTLTIDEIEVEYEQDLYGCYVFNREKKKMKEATEQPFINIVANLGLTNFTFDLFFKQSFIAFSDFFFPYLYTNSIYFDDSNHRLKFFNLKLNFEENAQINLPFNINSNSMADVSVICDKNSSFEFTFPMNVSNSAENRFISKYQLVNPLILTSLSDSKIASIQKLEIILSKQNPETINDQIEIETQLKVFEGQLKIAPFHIEFFRSLFMNLLIFESNYSFKFHRRFRPCNRFQNSMKDDDDESISFFRPFSYSYQIELINSTIFLLSSEMPAFENINDITSHPNIQISASQIYIELTNKSCLIYHNEYDDIDIISTIKDAKFVFWLPENHSFQIRRGTTVYDHLTSPLIKIFIQFQRINRIENENNKFKLNKGIKMKFESQDFEGLMTYFSIHSITNTFLNYVQYDHIQRPNRPSNSTNHNATNNYEINDENLLKLTTEYFWFGCFPVKELFVKIKKISLKLPYDLYDPSDYSVLNCCDLSLIYLSSFPFSSVILSMPAVTLTCDLTNHPCDQFYYEEIQNTNQGILHINDITIKQTVIDSYNGFLIGNQNFVENDLFEFFINQMKKKKLNEFSSFYLHKSYSIDLGEISAFLGLTQVFQLIDLISNSLFLWKNIESQNSPSEIYLAEIYFLKTLNLRIGPISLFCDNGQHGLFTILLPSGIALNQDNLINKDSHSCTFITIPTIDIHHVIGEDHAGSSLKPILRLTTYLNLIRRHQFPNSEYDSKRQIEILNQFDFASKQQSLLYYFIHLNKPQQIQTIFNENVFESNLEENYSIMQTFKRDPANDNRYELILPIFQFSKLKEFVNYDDLIIWQHQFVLNRFFNHFFEFKHNKNVKNAIEQPQARQKRLNSNIVDSYYTDLNYNNQNSYNYIKTIDIDRFKIKSILLHVNIPNVLKVKMATQMINIISTFNRIVNLAPDSRLFSKIVRDEIYKENNRQNVTKRTFSIIIPGFNFELIDVAYIAQLSSNRIQWISHQQINPNRRSLSTGHLSTENYFQDDLIHNVNISAFIDNFQMDFYSYNDIKIDEEDLLNPTTGFLFTHENINLNQFKQKLISLNIPNIILSSENSLFIMKLSGIDVVSKSEAVRLQGQLIHHFIISLLSFEMPKIIKRIMQLKSWLSKQVIFQGQLDKFKRIQYSTNSAISTDLSALLSTYYSVYKLLRIKDFMVNYKFLSNPQSVNHKVSFKFKIINEYFNSTFISPFSSETYIKAKLRPIIIEYQKGNISTSLTIDHFDLHISKNEILHFINFKLPDIPKTLFPKVTNKQIKLFELLCKRIEIKFEDLVDIDVDDNSFCLAISPTDSKIFLNNRVLNINVCNILKLNLKKFNNLYSFDTKTGFIHSNSISLTVFLENFLKNHKSLKFADQLIECFSDQKMRQTDQKNTSLIDLIFSRQRIFINIEHFQSSVEFQKIQLTIGVPGVLFLITSIEKDYQNQQTDFMFNIKKTIISMDDFIHDFEMKSMIILGTFLKVEREINFSILNDQIVVEIPEGFLNTKFLKFSKIVSNVVTEFLSTFIDTNSEEKRRLIALKEVFDKQRNNIDASFNFFTPLFKIDCKDLHDCIVFHEPFISFSYQQSKSWQVELKQLEMYKYTPTQLLNHSFLSFLVKYSTNFLTISVIDMDFYVDQNILQDDFKFIENIKSDTSNIFDLAFFITKILTDSIKNLIDKLNDKNTTIKQFLIQNFIKAKLFFELRNTTIKFLSNQKQLYEIELPALFYILNVNQTKEAIALETIIPRLKLSINHSKSYFFFEKIKTTGLILSDYTKLTFDVDYANFVIDTELIDYVISIMKTSDKSKGIENQSKYMAKQKLFEFFEYLKDNGEQILNEKINGRHQSFPSNELVRYYVYSQMHLNKFEMLTKSQRSSQRSIDLIYFVINDVYPTITFERIISSNFLKPRVCIQLNMNKKALIKVTPYVIQIAEYVGGTFIPIFSEKMKITVVVKVQETEIKFYNFFEFDSQNFLNALNFYPMTISQIVIVYSTKNQCINGIIKDIHLFDANNSIAAIPIIHFITSTTNNCMYICKIELDDQLDELNSFNSSFTIPFMLMIDKINSNFSFYNIDELLIQYKNQFDDGQLVLKKIGHMRHGLITSNNHQHSFRIDQMDIISNTYGTCEVKNVCISNDFFTFLSDVKINFHHSPIDWSISNVTIVNQLNKSNFIKNNQLNSTAIDAMNSNEIEEEKSDDSDETHHKTKINKNQVKSNEIEIEEEESDGSDEENLDLSNNQNKENDESNSKDVELNMNSDEMKKIEPLIDSNSNQYRNCISEKKFAIFMSNPTFSIDLVDIQLFEKFLLSIANIFKSYVTTKHIQINKATDQNTDESINSILYSFECHFNDLMLMILAKSEKLIECQQKDELQFSAKITYEKDSNEINESDNDVLTFNRILQFESTLSTFSMFYQNTEIEIPISNFLMTFHFDEFDLNAIKFNGFSDLTISSDEIRNIFKSLIKSCVCSDSNQISMDNFQFDDQIPFLGNEIHEVGTQPQNISAAFIFNNLFYLMKVYASE